MFVSIWNREFPQLFQELVSHPWSFCLIDVHINLWKYVECRFTFRSVYPSGHSFISTILLIRLDTVNYFGMTLDQNWKWSIHLFMLFPWLFRNHVKIIWKCLWTGVVPPRSTRSETWPILLGQNIHMCIARWTDYLCFTRKFVNRLSLPNLVVVPILRYHWRRSWQFCPKNLR